jgi:endonuclease YncB( thermonuclease family)
MAPFREFTGFVQVLEGDLIAVNGTLVRLYGIDAPEMGQTCRSRRGQRYDCGAAARNILSRLIGDREVACSAYAEQASGELIARCRIGRADLGAAMVRRGWAYPMVSLTNRYTGEEAHAQAAGAGVWSGWAQRPWVWRHEQERAGRR